jgi:integrase
MVVADELKQEIDLENRAQNESMRSIITSKQRIYPVTEGIQSKHTRLTYQQNFDRFLNKISIRDQQVLLDFSSKVIKQMIIDYIHYLSEEKGIRRNSIKTQIAPIIHFFKINNDDFNLRMDNFKLHLPPDESVNEDRPYTTEEIARVIGEADLRSKVAILLLCSSGMRMGALHSLQICNLTEIRSQNQTLYKVQAYARTRDKYLTFCTCECYDAIQDYLSYRKRSGEELKDKSPLIREQFNPDNPFTINTPRFVSRKTIEYILTRALKQSGVRKPGEVHMSHGFRKFFINQCENNSSMKSLFVDVLANHDIGVKKHYLRVKESELLQEYLKAVDALTINQENKLQTRVNYLENEKSEKIAQLEERVQYLDEWAHRWAKRYHALEAGNTTEWDSKTDKTHRLKIQKEPVT